MSGEMNAVVVGVVILMIGVSIPAWFFARMKVLSVEYPGGPFRIITIGDALVAAFYYFHPFFLIESILKIRIRKDSGMVR